MRLAAGERNVAERVDGEDAFSLPAGSRSSASTGTPKRTTPVKTSRAARAPSVDLRMQMERDRMQEFLWKTKIHNFAVIGTRRAMNTTPDD
jgi:hypothetical protein